MIKKITYIAEDGEEFETEEECMAHEQFTASMPGIFCFDWRKEYLNPHDGVNEAFTDARYIVVTDKQKAKITFDYLSEYTGCEAPNCGTDIGLFSYDGDRDRWNDMSARVISDILDVSSIVEELKCIDQEAGESVARYFQKNFNDALLMAFGSSK